MRKPRWYSVEKLHEEAKIPPVSDIQIRLANEYLKREKESKIESILELIQKKKTTTEKQLSKHIGSSVLLLIFTFNFDKIFVCTNNDKILPSPKTVGVQ